MYASSEHERIRLRAMGETVVAALLSLDSLELRTVLEQCDPPTGFVASNKHLLPPKGFWRVDKDKPPELRQTVLALVAFHDLQEKIAACGGDVEKGIEAFLSQNDGEGWMLPETLRLADYGLGHDERAKEHQPVRAKFGPRFYDWQLVQSAEESWRECHLHARNLLGEEGYRKLLVEVLTRREEPLSPERREEYLRYARGVLSEAAYRQLLADLQGGDPPNGDSPGGEPSAPPGALFDATDMPLFRRREGR